MLQNSFARFQLIRPFASYSIRLYSSDNKPPRPTRKKDKGPMKSKDSAKITKKLAPSSSELLDDFLNQAIETKQRASKKSKSQNVETKPSKTGKTREEKSEKPATIISGDKDVIKSMALLRDFVDNKGQPSQKFTKIATQTSRKLIRFRHTETLPQPAKLNLFDEKSFQEYVPDESAYKNDVFNEINALEASAYRAKSTHNHFEELIQWTLDGKLWKFPINNEQDWYEELNTPFHEHVFINRYLKNKKAGVKNPAPLKAFMDLVCAGLGQNPYITAEQKREHLQWFEGYFATKVKDIQAAVDEEKRIAEAEAKARSAKS